MGGGGAPAHNWGVRGQEYSTTSGDQRRKPGLLTPGLALRGFSLFFSATEIKAQLSFLPPDPALNSG